MNRVVRTGVDLAKNIIQRHGVDAAERVMVRKAVSRDRLLEWFVNREPCVIAMEAYSSAHFWARRGITVLVCPTIEGPNPVP
ncbi:hypothetical protein [Paraburkholderia humisilvae]|uniref:Uncharacterized protein n=1 Tax=Paraburkholderia humisilvae TaxID=627669 RepID=A0A6J5F7J6_9BURK|nr:hypothetical protein [Paraburkholderia humisilvae]CAB3774860.1 hypothetical protein LMG29542_08242 [Paraburkholderia humisilvae]